VFFEIFPFDPVYDPVESLIFAYTVTSTVPGDTFQKLSFIHAGIVIQSGLSKIIPSFVWKRVFGTRLCFSSKRL